MSIATVTTTNAANLSAQPGAFPRPQQRDGTQAPFGSLLKDAVTQANLLDEQAHAAAVGLMTGKGIDVHEAVIAAQKAEMTFELALSVRNKAVQAYQGVMGMQF